MAVSSLPLPHSPLWFLFFLSQRLQGCVILQILTSYTCWILESSTARKRATGGVIDTNFRSWFLPLSSLNIHSLWTTYLLREFICVLAKFGGGEREGKFFTASWLLPASYIQRSNNFFLLARPSLCCARVAMIKIIVSFPLSYFPFSRLIPRQIHTHSLILISLIWN